MQLWSSLTMYMGTQHFRGHPESPSQRPSKTKSGTPDCLLWFKTLRATWVTQGWGEERDVDVALPRLRMRD